MNSDPPAGIAIRPATPSDSAAIHQVSVAACRAAYTDILDDHTFIEMVDDAGRVPRLRERLEDANADDGLVYLVAVAEDAIVAFVQLVYGERTPEHVPPGEAFLRSLYVHPDRWHEGIGTALLESARERLPSDTVGIRLGVLKANADGRRFYEARGYEQVGERTFEIGGVTYPTVVYATRLDVSEG